MGGGAELWDRDVGGGGGGLSLWDRDMSLWDRDGVGGGGGLSLWDRDGGAELVGQRWGG